VAGGAVNTLVTKLRPALGPFASFFHEWLYERIPFWRYIECKVACWNVAVVAMVEFQIMQIVDIYCIAACDEEIL